MGGPRGQWSGPAPQVAPTPSSRLGRSPRRQIKIRKCSSFFSPPPAPPSFFLFVCVCQCGTQGHSQKHTRTARHQMVTPFPQLVGVKTGPRPPCAGPAPVGGFVSRGRSAAAPAAIQPRTPLCPFAQGSSLPMCACTQKMQPFRAHSPCRRKDGDISLLNGRELAGRLSPGKMNLE